ncbi:MAG: hypothetical protein IPO45_11805 [Saprospiraceae bacterium]|nr:hypothetical protein [Candidatus Brachybacter algidus]
MSSIGKNPSFGLVYVMSMAMKHPAQKLLNTYYKLMTDKNLDVLLKDLIIIIDPCLNPDGRERHQLVTSMSGTNADTNFLGQRTSGTLARGRANHYHFDLNRDQPGQTRSSRIPKSTCAL